MSPTATAAKNIEIVRAYLACVEHASDAGGVSRFWHAEGVFEELPNAIAPNGSKRDRAALAASFQRGRALLASQHYEIINVFGAGDQVMVEFVWTGSLKVDAGPLRAGETLRARCAGVFEVRDGLIYRQRQYDCYDPRS